MSKQNEGKIEVSLSPDDLLQTIGDWFEAKRILYSDEMFVDYHNMVKDKISETNEMIEYLNIKVQEKVFQWLSVHHSNRKEVYQKVEEKDEELVPAWFLQERFKELEMMISSKFFSYGFKDIAMEFDSALKQFIVSLFSDKEMDEMSLSVLSSDIQAYLENQLTLLDLEESKILEKKQIELVFSLIW
ncbi:MAG: hypothetical protein ACTSYH_06165 [Candidatus Heimdallarchaeaceae archaeon]